MSKRMRTSFALTPGWVIERVTDPGAFRYYAHLAWKYANAERHAFPRQATVAEELGVSERSVQRFTQVLRDAGALIVQRELNPDGSLGRNLYWLPLDDPHDRNDPPSVSPDPTPVAGRADQGKHPVSAGRLDPTPVAGPAEQPKHPVSAGQPDPQSASGPIEEVEPDPLQPDPTNQRTTGVGPVDQSDRLDIRARDAEAPTGRQRAREPDDHGEARAVIDTLAARTGKAITDDHHVKRIIKQLLGDRPGVRDPVSYLIGAIRNDPDPYRFLPTPTPPPFRSLT